MTAVRDSSGTALASYRFDARSRRIALTYANGASAAYGHVIPARQRRNISSSSASIFSEERVSPQNKRNHGSPRDTGTQSPVGWASAHAASADSEKDRMG